MIYKCYECGNVTFKPSHCSKCETSEPIPLYPEYYTDFIYRSKGLVKDLFGKKRATQELENYKGRVLQSYDELRTPYFVNFNYLSRVNIDSIDFDSFIGPSINANYCELELFRDVLVNAGFEDLRNNPEILVKLLKTTAFYSDYIGFRREAENWVKNDIISSLTSFVSHLGVNYRNHLELFLFVIMSKNSNCEGLIYNDMSQDEKSPLFSDEFIAEQRELCELFYYSQLLDTMKNKLAYFDPNKFVTIYQVDSLDGYTFEDFLVKLFTTIGYSVEGTKKTADQGADLFVEKFGRKTVIQAKNYTGNVGNKAVQEALSAKAFYDCDAAMVVTNSYFTKSAKELASASGVELVDRERLEEYLNEYNDRLISERFESDKAE